MSRIDGDSWDLATSVGATATSVAASRALGHREGLINDPYAADLVHAVGIDYCNRVADGTLDFDGDPLLTKKLMCEQIAVRTRFFDDFFTEAGAAGIRQAVILASGLDTRAYRLAWPAGSTVFELDQPQVIDFKTRVLDELGATPAADRRTVRVDLRDDWPKALRDSGFDPSAPTAWIAEGLLIYLPPEAQDRLLDNITALSAPGSRIATEHMDLQALSGDWADKLTERSRRYGSKINLSELFYSGERTAARDHLREAGWQVSVLTTDDAYAANGFAAPDDEITKLVGDSGYLTATLGRRRGDTWDLASSVGATATMVAAARAVASADPDPLIDDPYAGPLVRAVGIDFFTRMLDGDLDMSQFPDSSPERVQAMIDGMAVRTRFFDDYFAAAAEAGIRQVVILASGLDSRAYRLHWPDQTVVYELDQPEVIEFKSRTLAGLGALPTAIRRTAPIDLREDWPTALRQAGFDPDRPTAWLAEGLLIYLPPEAQDRLFDDITALSAPGSAMATEYVPGIMDFDNEASRERTAAIRAQGLDIDMSALVYSGPRSHVMEYLGEKGWRVTGSPRGELFVRYQRTVPETNPDDALGEIVYVSATLG